MRHLPLIGLLLLAPLAWGLAPGNGRPGVQARESADPPRVVVRVGAKRLVKGYLELEDESVIIVRTLDGDLERFIKPRVTRITHLLDASEHPACVVHLTSGERREGVLIEDEFDHVTLEIEGIRSRFPREVVEHVSPAPTFEERYQRYKESIEGRQPSRHLALCQWLVDERQYALAQKELAELQTYADGPTVRRLINLVDAQLSLEREAEQRQIDAPPRTTNQEQEAGPVDLADLLPDELITAEGANLIRVYEIDFENPPRVSVSPEARRKLIEQYATHALMPASQSERNALFRSPAIDVVRLMFDMRARDLYADIEVESEPRALNLFRQRVHNAWLMNHCASTQCHGGLKGGRLFLHRRNHRNERVWLTNLLILERLEIDPAWPLINYEQPTDSLLLQHALPTELARVPHPPVEGWKPVLTPQTRGLMEDAIEWIESMMQPRPSYPVDYEPPVLVIDAESGDAAEAGERVDR